MVKILVCLLPITYTTCTYVLAGVLMLYDLAAAAAQYVTDIIGGFESTNRVLVFHHLHIHRNNGVGPESVKQNYGNFNDYQVGLLSRFTLWLKANPHTESENLKLALSFILQIF